MIRKILWTVGIIIIFITIINYVSEIIDSNWFIFWLILGSLFIGITELVIYLKTFFQIKKVGALLDEHERVTEQQAIKYFDEPAYKVLPFFRNYKKGLIVNSSGKYIHYNKEFIEKIIEEYEKTPNITELSAVLKLSKIEIKDIIDKLKEKEKI